MRSRFVFFIFSWIMGWSLHASELSLVTCEPGDALYSAYGHSALRYKTADMDIVFNFGTFNFSTSNFYVNFANGILDYQMSISHYTQFVARYKYLNRNITEQRLNIDTSTVDKIALDLMTQYKLGQHIYRYDFVQANCATKIWDVFKKHLPELHTDTAGMQMVSYRTLMNTYTRSSFPWLKLSTDLILGKRLDQQLTAEQTSFLPDFLKELVEHSFNGPLPLVADTQQQLFVENSRPASSIPQPGFVIGVVFILAMIRLIRLSSVSNRSFVIDKVFFVIVGLLGIVVWYMNFASEHYTTANNWNLIWANPFIFMFLLPIVYRIRLANLVMGIIYVGFPVVALCVSQQISMSLLLMSHLVGWHLLDRAFRIYYLKK